MRERSWPAKSRVSDVCPRVCFRSWSWSLPTNYPPVCPVENIKLLVHFPHCLHLRFLWFVRRTLKCGWCCPLTLDLKVAATTYTYRYIYSYTSRYTWVYIATDIFADLGIFRAPPPLPRSIYNKDGSPIIQPSRLTLAEYSFVFIVMAICYAWARKSSGRTPIHLADATQAPSN